MLEQLIGWDKELMLAINHAHTPFMDVVMQIASYKYSIVPVCVLILYLLFFRQSCALKSCKGLGQSCESYDTEGKNSSRANIKRALLYLLAIVVTFAICDSGSTILFKHTICRLRPCHDPSMMDLVRMLEYKGGQYGFISSHAANLFGLALVSSFAIRRRWYTILIFCWAALVAYSRVYVGKHFPGDVICGAIFGLVVGLLVIYIVNLLQTRHFEKREQI